MNTLVNNPSVYIILSSYVLLGQSQLRFHILVSITNWKYFFDYAQTQRKSLQEKCGQHTELLNDNVGCKHRYYYPTESYVAPGRFALRIFAYTTFYHKAHALHLASYRNANSFIRNPPNNVEHLKSLKPTMKKVNARKLFTFPLLSTELASVIFTFMADVIIQSINFACMFPIRQ